MRDPNPGVRSDDPLGGLVHLLPVAAVHLRAGRVVEANQRAEELLGWPPEQLPNRLVGADRDRLRSWVLHWAASTPAPGAGTPASEHRDESEPTPTSAPDEMPHSLTVRSDEGPPRRFLELTAGPHPDGGALVAMRDVSQLWRLEAAVNEFSTGIYTTDANLVGQWMPTEVADNLGISPEIFAGTDIYRLVHPDDHGHARELLTLALDHPGVRYASSLRVRHPAQPGIYWPILTTIVWLPDDDALGGMLVRFDAGLSADVAHSEVVADHTGPWPAAATASGDPTGVITLGDASPLGFLNLTVDGRVLQRSTRVQEILRPVLGDALEADWRRFVHPDDVEAVTQRLEKARRGELASAMEVAFVSDDAGNTDREGATVFVRLDVLPYRDAAGEVAGMFVNFLDITAEREARDALAAAREQLEHLANHDVLTGLENRMPFTARLHQVLSGAADALGRADRTRPALLVCDLDDFKAVNDRHGHAVGDAVLVETGRRLQAAVRREDSVCRFGGDELLVLCERVDGEHELGAVARRVVAAFDPPMHIEGVEVTVGISVGAALAEPDDVADPDRLLRRADRALYRAKAAGRGRAVLADTDTVVQASDTPSSS